jgi:hypothetical protein
VKERPALAQKIDALYAGPLDDFVSERNALAKELRSDGKRDEAEHVKGLGKPSVAAGLINRLAHERPDEMKAFAKAAAALRKASGKKLREAARAERDAAAALLDAADELLEEEGGGTGATRDRVIETLQAAAADPGLEDLVVSGRLDKERSIASVGFALGVDDGGGGEDDDEGAEDEEETAADRKRRERELKAAEKRVHTSKAALRKANEAKKRTEKKLAAAEKALQSARDADRQAAAKVLEAETDLQGHEDALNEL